MASPRRGAKLTFTYHPVIQNLQGFYPNHQEPTYGVWKWLDINCSLYCAHKTLYIVIVTISYTQWQSAKIDLDLWPHYPKSIGFLLSSSTTYMWSLKVIGQKIGLYPAHKILYTECQSWPWPLTPLPKINRFPLLMTCNLHVKFESNWAKTVVCILLTRSFT